MIRVGGYVAQPTGRTRSSDKKHFGIALPRRTTATAWVLNESTYETKYDGLELPLGPAHCSRPEIASL
jgi:hypothetical protein